MPLLPDFLHRVLFELRNYTLIYVGIECDSPTCIFPLSIQMDAATILYPSSEIEFFGTTLLYCTYIFYLFSVFLQGSFVPNIVHVQPCFYLVT